MANPKEQANKPKQEDSAARTSTKPGKGTHSTGRKSKDKANMKGSGGSNPKQQYFTSWPRTYTDVATHPNVRMTNQDISVGTTKVSAFPCAILWVAPQVPTDPVDKLGDAVEVNYKLLKSMTSGARYYSSNTMYAYAMKYRALTVILARAAETFGALHTTLDVYNSPVSSAFNLIWGGESYADAMSKESAYRGYLMEMVSELNTFPFMKIWDPKTMFDLSHIIKDPHGTDFTYISMVLRRFINVTYADRTSSAEGHMTGISVTDMPENYTIRDMYLAFLTIVEEMRASVDMNNMCSDLINAFPNSTFDWMPVVQDLVSNLVIPMTGELDTALQNASMVTGGTMPTPALTADSRRAYTPAVSVDRYTKCAEVDRALFQIGSGNELDALRLTGINTTTIGGTAIFANVGFIIMSPQVFSTLGTVTTKGVIRFGYVQAVESMLSTTQGTAEQGAKHAMAAVRWCHVPAVYCEDFGTDETGFNYIAVYDSIKVLPAADAVKNIQAINAFQINTRQVTTKVER